MKNIILIFLFSFQITSCQERNVKPTPEKFISKIEVPNKLYLNDSLKLVELIKFDIKEHKDGYSSRAYDDFTEIIIDTIIYSPDYGRLVFFVITKVENKKTYPRGWTQKDVEEVIQHTRLPFEGHHYQGKSYIGIRNEDSSIEIIFFGLTTAKYKKIEDVRERQKQLFFEEYATVEEEGYEYNINDTRFWDNSNFWNKIKRKKE